jgi:hypothetical protein
MGEILISDRSYTYVSTVKKVFAMVFDINKLKTAAASADEPIDENSTGGKYGYRIGHRSDSYEIPDVILNSPNHRKIRVLTVGAGMSGILMAYLFQKYGENIEHVIYEKNGDIGGTWLEVCF